MKLLFSLLICCMMPLKAVVIGSNTAFASQSAFTFPVADADNEMRGFSSFSTVTFANALTTCLFNAVPSCSSIALAGGTLTLQKDCVIESNQPFLSGGIIDGNNYQMALMSTSTRIQLVPSSTALSQISLITTVNAGAIIYSVDWSYDDQYVAVVTGLQTGNELFIYYFDNNTLTLRASVALSALGNSVAWHPTSYRLAVGMNSVSGNDLLIYNFDAIANTLTLTGGADQRGNCLITQWHPGGNRIVASSSTTSKELILYTHSNGALSSTLNYDINPNRAVQKYGLCWDPSGTYLAVGTATSSGNNNLFVYSFNGTALTLAFGTTISSTVRSIDWSSSGSYLAVGLSSGSQRLRVYSINTGTSTISEVTAARVGEASSVFCVHWSPDSNYLAIGRAVSSTGTEFRVYQFNSTAGTLSLIQEYNSTADVHSVRWSHDGTHLAVGDALSVLTVYRWNGASPYLNNLILKNVALRFYSDLTVPLPVKIQGNCRIDGNGRTFDMSAGSGSIIVDAGATVLLENMTLAGVQTTDISCLDTLGTVSLSNVVLQHTANSSFATGSLAVIGDVTMTGGYQFSYTSPRRLIVGSLSQWYFDSGMTFQYAPSSEMNNLLSLTDSSSVLYLCDATLNISTAGLQLTKGALTIEGTCSVVNAGTSSAQGLAFGDGSSSANNLSLRVLAGSGFQVQSGYLVNKNV